MLLNITFSRLDVKVQLYTTCFTNSKKFNVWPYLKSRTPYMIPNRHKFPFEKVHFLHKYFIPNDFMFNAEHHVKITQQKIFFYEKDLPINNHERKFKIFKIKEQLVSYRNITFEKVFCFIFLSLSLCFLLSN